MLKKLLVTKILFIFFAVFSISRPALADDIIYTGLLSNVALKGYDTVTYFQGDGVPQKGAKDFKTKWNGANWYFISEANLKAFESEPTKYAPQYGGYCAWAAAHGTLAKGDPKVYTLKDGKVYLNFDKSIDALWSPRKDELIPKADEQYPELVDLP